MRTQWWCYLPAELAFAVQTPSYQSLVQSFPHCSSRTTWRRGSGRVLQSKHLFSSLPLMWTENLTKSQKRKKGRIFKPLLVLCLNWVTHKRCITNARSSHRSKVSNQQPFPQQSEANCAWAAEMPLISPSNSRCTPNSFTLLRQDPDSDSFTEGHTLMSFVHLSWIFHLVPQLQHRVLNDLLQRDSGQAKSKTQVSLVPGYYDNQPMLENIPCHCLTLLFINKTRFTLF